MAEFIEREAALESVREKLRISESLPDCISKRASVFTLASMNDSLKSIPASDVVSRDAYDQTDWERCVALTQLKEIGKGLGERMDDVRPVVKAAWEDTSNPQWPAHSIRHCPCCGWSIPKSKLRAKDSSWNFCPNCGADMRTTT